MSTCLETVDLYRFGKDSFSYFKFDRFKFALLPNSIDTTTKYNIFSLFILNCTEVQSLIHSLYFRISHFIIESIRKQDLKILIYNIYRV